MWESYGGNHAGFCLVVDLARLLGAFSTLVHTARAFRFDGPVEYPLDLVRHFENLNIDVTTVELEEVPAAVRAHLQARERQHFRTKNRDWSAEDEYRLGVLGAGTDDPRLIPVEEAAVAIVVGPCAQSDELRRVSKLVDALGLGQSVGQLHWYNGIPEVWPCVRVQDVMRGLTVEERRDGAALDDLTL